MPIIRQISTLLRDITRQAGAVKSRERDGKYAGFDATVKRLRVKALKGPVATPTSRAYDESFIGNVRRECLNHFLFLGITHLDSVLKTWLGYYHRHRPHQGVENELLIKPKAPRGRKKRTDEPNRSRTEIHCEQQLGGLLKSYSRKAA